MSLFTPLEPVPGQVIVLCTWLGAASKHINKYVLSHRSITPRSRILLITSDVSILTSTYPAQRKAIKPAVQAILSDIDECSQDNKVKVLIHTFSNGGTNSATHMLLELGKQRGPSAASRGHHV
jgi:hypothetical protein